MPESNVQKFNGAGQTEEERQAYLAQVAKNRAERNEISRKIDERHGLKHNSRDLGGGFYFIFIPP